MTPASVHADIAIIGAGAAGLAAAYFAAQRAPALAPRILLLEGARKPGAKILISGGGRCNVTNERVTERDFSGGPPRIIRNILRAFNEQKTLEWMQTLGVPLKLEPTGKYFPQTDSARTVLDALLRTVGHAGVRLRSAARIAAIEHRDGAFLIRFQKSAEAITVRRVVLATGGLSLPKSGSDGWGIETARRLGHAIIPTTPALAPLVLKPGPAPGGQFAELAGITLNARLTLTGTPDRKPHTWTDSLLFTHFGISGPAALNISRHLLRARLEHPGTSCQLTLGVPELATPADAEQWLLRQANENGRRHAVTTLEQLLPERIARLIAPPDTRLSELTRSHRQTISANLTALPLHVLSDRGYSFAETTAGGIDLREINSHTMESRVLPGLHLCGEMLDADGRIGGFNFQWAWATGHLAGRAAAAGF